MNAKISLWAMNEAYKHDHPDKDIFEKWILPDRLSSVKDDITDVILLDCGEFEMLWSDIEFFAEALCVFGKKYYRTFDRWAETLDQEYSPIENYDRQEDWSDFSHGSRFSNSENKNNSSVDSNTIEQNSQNNNIENKVSGYDDDSYSPKDKQESGSSMNASSGTFGTTADSSESKSNESSADNAEHVGRVHGNIGVTTAATMITEEMQMRLKQNLYKKISDIFCAEFALMIY